MRVKKSAKARRSSKPVSTKRVSRAKRKVAARTPSRPAPVARVERVAAPEPVMRSEPAIQPQAATRPEVIARTELPARRPPVAHPRAAGTAARPWLTAAAIAIVGSVALFAAHRPSHVDDVASIDTAPDTPTVRNVPAATAGTDSAPAAPVNVVPRIIPEKAVAPATAANAPASVVPPKAAAPTVAAKVSPIDPAVKKAPAVDVAHAAVVNVVAAVPPAAPEPEKTPMRPIQADVEEPAAAPVSISGCLERNDDGFLLKNTSGADAPKSRSWKAAFLKKRSVPIELVDNGALRLQRYVGQRVTATGTLTDREMHPRSVRIVATSCS